MYPFQTRVIGRDYCTGSYQNGLCRYLAQITRKWANSDDASREAILTISLSSFNGTILIQDIRAIANHCCRQLCRDGCAPKSVQIEILGFRWADQPSLVPKNGGNSALHGNSIRTSAARRGQQSWS